MITKESNYVTFSTVTDTHTEHILKKDSLKNGAFQPHYPLTRRCVIDNLQVVSPEGTRV